MMFTPGRLTLARKRRGLTKTALARKSVVALRSITAYEGGTVTPSEDAVSSLASALGFPAAFFYRPETDTPTPENVSFRAMKSMTARQRDAALGAGALAMELSRWIGDRFDLPDPTVPDLDGLDPETAADTVRDSWGLGAQPIGNVVHLLESKGIRVFSLAEETLQVDAFSFWLNGTPYVFLNTKKSGERSRHDAAHELGHLVMHRAELPPSRDIEREANQFASAFLMPRSSVLAHLPDLISVPRLVTLKRIWKVSVAALAYRMHALGVVSDWHFRTLFTEISQQGYRREEPDGIERESSQVLRKVFGLLRKEGISKTDIARDLSIAVGEIDALIFGLAMTSVEGGGAGAAPSERPALRLVPTKRTD